MPLYEFQCPKCGSREEIFRRTIVADLEVPPCPNAGGEPGHDMRRVVSKFAQHKTVADQLADAEAKWGQEVESVMGPGPDVGRFARRYDELARDLPPPDVPVTE
jgi:putative FmdB family regulatory protein